MRIVYALGRSLDDQPLLASGVTFPSSLNLISIGNPREPMVQFQEESDNHS